MQKLTLGSDLNGDGSIDFFDNSAFMGWYGAGDLRADLNGDAAVNFFDVSLFTTMYSQQGFWAFAERCERRQWPRQHHRLRGVPLGRGAGYAALSSPGVRPGTRSLDAA